MEPSTSPPVADMVTPLSDFQKIGHNTYLWTSSSYLSQLAEQTPLILLFTWNAAAAKYIAKYTLAYQKLFPTSRILLVRCFTPDMFRRTSSYATLLEPTTDLVAEHTASGGRILVHSFSNGGGNQVNEFAKAWKKNRSDTMVRFEEADEHADLAKAKGWDVTKVQFEKSPHCGHIREDENKYWAAVMEAWKKGPRSGNMST
ncbi:uncharacterized protein J4E84_008261 [Alternaria hordeiaustralica]|uniref:uncharacterized protein n=1 Tax=Alternaria hordeiaustralica TaxID=1187925 RepID=UPI0020C3C100|nr:uncharacterized protein J4E84_008261 [Alternaria hordeiaustralica]KAI4679738.1 hypothetical protein J4E84_008261 [Alternaria hordeiaustralica]